MKTLLSIFQSSVEQYPDKPALLMRPSWRLVRLSFRQVNECARVFAALLAKEGVGYQDRVILIAPNSPYWGCAYFGILLRGAIVVPLNPTSSSDFFERVINETAARVIIASSSLKLSFPSHVKVFDLDNYNEIKKEVSPSEEVIALKPEDTAQIVYTSGTTGEPKGVILSHANIVSNIEAVCEVFQASSADRAVSILPLFHVFEQTIGLLGAFHFGIAIFYASNVSSRALLSALQEHRATKMMLVPEILEALVHKIEHQAEQEGKEQWFRWLLKVAPYFPRTIRRLLFRKIHKQFGGKLELLMSGGAPLGFEIEKTLNALGFLALQGYGLTETSPVVSSNTPSVHRARSVGKVVPKTKVTIASDGEILVEGPNVFSGYYKNEAQTSKVFDEKGRFKTGDLGYFDQDQFLYIQGRKKYVIVTARGEKIYPEDLEQQLKKIPGVIDAAVVGRIVNGKEVAHAVLLGHNLDGNSVIEKANQSLARYQHIQEWSLWPEADFPRSATRKVKKDILISWLANHNNLEEQTDHGQTTAMQRLLANISGKPLRSVLSTSKLVSDLHFDSLMRIELVGRIEELFDREISEQFITLQTTVQDLENEVQNGKPPKKQRKLYTWHLAAPLRIISDYLMRIIAFPLYSLPISIEIEGKEHLDKLGSQAIFMANHTSYVDTLFVLYALPASIRRKIAVAAASDFLYGYYWYVAPLAELFFNTYPFPRKEEESIKPGLDATGRLLDHGQSILIFPEGKINTDDTTMLPLKHGAGLLAAEMNVPVVPVVVYGLAALVPEDKIFPRRRGKVVVRFGTPLVFDHKYSYEEATALIEKEMKRLLVRK